MKKLLISAALLSILSYTTHAFHIEAFAGAGISNMNTGAEQTTFSSQVGTKYIFFHGTGIQFRVGYINLEGSSAIVPLGIGVVTNLYEGLLPFDAYLGVYGNVIVGNESFGYSEYTTFNLGAAVPINGNTDVFVEYETPFGNNADRAPKLVTVGLKGRVGFFW